MALRSALMSAIFPFMAGLVWAIPSANAAAITYMFTAPEGVVQNGPVTATLQDVSGGVLLSINTSFGPSSGNFVSSMSLNLATHSSALVDNISILRTDSGGQPVVWSKDFNNISAGPQRQLDIKASFAVPAGGVAAQCLDKTRTVSFLLSAQGLTSSAIDEIVIHVQGLSGAETSAWETGVMSSVPLPSSVKMFGVALIGLGILGWARRRRQSNDA